MAEGFRIRLDMKRTEAEGYKACKDGQGRGTCPYKRGEPSHSEWQDGFTRAERDNEKEKARQDEKFR
jgi:ribosome modulation factor